MLIQLQLIVILDLYSKHGRYQIRKLPEITQSQRIIEIIIKRKISRKKNVQKRVKSKKTWSKVLKIK